MPNYYKHITKDGESFDLLALYYYTNERLAHVIMQANPDYMDRVVFEGGIELKIPEIEKPETTKTKAPWRR